MHPVMYPIMHHILISSGVEFFKGINIIVIGCSGFFILVYPLVFVLVLSLVSISVFREAPSPFSADYASRTVHCIINDST